MATPESKEPSWPLRTDDPDHPCMISVRPSHHKNARDMIPVVLDVLSGFMATEHGAQLLEDGATFFQDVSKGEQDPNADIRLDLPALARIVQTVTGPGREVWKFIENHALPALTTLEVPGHDDYGLFTERVALAAGAITWHYNENNRVETQAALKKSVSATSEALSKKGKAEAPQTETTQTA